MPKTLVQLGPDDGAISRAANTRGSIPVSPDLINRRDPAVIMRLARLGSLHQCRLSFMRILIRRIAGERWRFERSAFSIASDATGHAVYTVHGPLRSYSLVAFAHNLKAEQRTDRVIAEAWDSTFTLFDGIPTDADITRLAANVPLQESGRLSASELTLSRANRSVRLWEHIVDALSQGNQPDLEEVSKVGYLMRTTAVYGSGKFGAADREMIAERAEMHAPFQAEMLTVYLIRTFALDLVQECARIRGAERAVTLDNTIGTRLGIGNSTGLGMAPFVINHPVLFNNWLIAREEAIARVRSVPVATEKETDTFIDLLLRNRSLLTQWNSAHPIQQKKLADLQRDITTLLDHIDNENLTDDMPWNRLILWSEQSLSDEGKEFVASLVLEPYGRLVDDLESCMSDSTSANFQIDGSMTTGRIRACIKRDFGWALDLDWSARGQCARVWYISEEKLEPRLGERFEEPVAEYEQALAPARDAVSTYRALSSYDDSQPIAEFLLCNPHHRQSIRRVQLSTFAPYSEIRDNTISAALMPIDMLRAKLAFFGATNFDPRSDRWLRICMFAGAPYPQELADSSQSTTDDWVYPDTSDRGVR